MSANGTDLPWSMGFVSWAQAEAFQLRINISAFASARNFLAVVPLAKHAVVCHTAFIGTEMPWFAHFEALEEIGADVLI
jgi:hypothetical protein